MVFERHYSSSRLSRKLEPIHRKLVENALLHPTGLDRGEFVTAVVMGIRAHRAFRPRPDATLRALVNREIPKLLRLKFLVLRAGPYGAVFRLHPTKKKAVKAYIGF